ncbi:MAG: hypothetical protein KAJ14_16420 [Candidatus Omnitrophica bacterium]|nr:hypothetical protein [Candidatus Omnitrophota bacterium]
MSLKLNARVADTTVAQATLFLVVPASVLWFRGLSLRITDKYSYVFKTLRESGGTADALA